jgi:hypothetical protein
VSPVTPAESEEATKLLHEAEEAIKTAGDATRKARDWLTKLIGTSSFEDQLQYGDGNEPPTEEDENG